MKLSNWLSILALIISGYVVCRDCTQSERISDLEYTASAMQFRPVLSVVGLPELDISLKRGPVQLVIPPPRSPHDTLSAEVTHVVRAKLCLKNTGSSAANILAEIVTDTLSGAPKVREWLLDEASRNRRLFPVASSEFYATRQMQPGDTTSVEFRREIKYPAMSGFTLHFLILYMNEGGGLYDTYYWARYASEPVVAPIERLADGEGRRVRIRKDELQRSVLLQDHSTDSWIYSREEKVKLLSYLRESLEQQ